MIYLGNFLLVLALLAAILLNTGVLAKAPPGGDAGVGYAWSLLILSTVYGITMIVVGLIIGAKGGFEWVSPNPSTRKALVTIGLVCSLVTFAAAVLLRHEGGPVPAVLRGLSSFVPILFPLLMIGAGFILLNAPLRNSVPGTFVRWPIVLVASIGVMGTAAMLFAWMQQSAANTRSEIAAMNNDQNTQRMLAEIDSCDVSKDLVFLLVFTGANQQDIVRNKAIAKLKTHPQWQQELVRLLQTDWAPEPFQFLAFNDVEDVAIFPEPVRIGILKQAELIRRSIREASHPSNFYAGQFTWEVERVLLTAERYKDKGVDYRPSVRELREAFNEPSEFAKPKWNCIALLDRWIKKNP